MNLEDEWKFIQRQTHKEKPSKKNLTKREMLFSLQLLLSNINEKEVIIYRQTKEFYLKNFT